MIRRAALPWLVMACAWLAACSLLTSFDDANLGEDSYDRCRDRADNDGDGHTDCDDDNCAVFNVCAELDPESCKDAVDNDGDGLTDCADPGCRNILDALLETYCNRETDCTDGVDDEGDGKVDCADLDCAKDAACLEGTDATCSDNVDNDKDGVTDCLDFDCYGVKACCTLAAPSLAGPFFSAVAGSCQNDTCVGSQACCSGADFSACCSGVQTCDPFAPERWIVWGLPRPRLAKGAFWVNKPCSCDHSGVVSVEQVRLEPGLEVAFELWVDPAATRVEQICAGLTRAVSYTEDRKQCSSASRPVLLAGVCLEARPDSVVTPDAGVPDAGPADAAAPDLPVPDAGVADAAADAATTPDGSPPDAADNEGGDAGGDSKPAPAAVKVRVKTIINGKLILSDSRDKVGAVPGSVKIDSSGRVSLRVGAVSHTTPTPIDPTLEHALVLIYGQGTAARLQQLKVTLPPTANKRCADPAAWLRHLVRGQPVVTKSQRLIGASQPSVTQGPKKGYMMLFTGQGGVSGGSKVGNGLFLASSSSGREFVLKEPGGILSPVIADNSKAFGWHVSSAALLYRKKAYQAWYTAAAKKNGPRGIAMVSSPDAEVWTSVRGNDKALHVLAPSASGWDSGTVRDPSVWADPASGLLYMWYTGDRWYPGATTEVPRPAIGLASSKDGGVSWTRLNGGEPVIANSGAGKDMAFEQPSVVFDGKQFLMWYTYHAFAAPPSIRFAVSLDRTNWHHWPAGSAMDAGPSGTFDERGVSSPSALLVKGRTLLWFGGVNIKGVAQLGYAENRGR